MKNTIKTLKAILFGGIAMIIMLRLTVCNAQESVETVIRKTREKCQSIQNGHYVMDRKMKYMSGNITYTVLFSDYKLSKTYHVHAFPTLFILDREGKIVKIHTGFSKEMGTELEEQLQKLL